MKNEWLRVLAAVAGLALAVVAAGCFAVALRVSVSRVLDTGVLVYFAFLLFNLAFVGASLLENRTRASGG